MAVNPTKTPTLKQWIEQFITLSRPRAKSVVMTLFREVITPHGGKIWLGSLIELLMPFGVSDRLVRTSVFWLAEEGWLNTKREGRRSLYTLNASASGRFKRAYQRGYAPSNKSWQGAWTLLFATASGITAGQRAGLRKELLWEGCGMIGPALFGHPCADPKVLREILDPVEVRDKVFVCKASTTEMLDGRPLNDLVAQCWQFESVVADYERYIQCFASLPKLLSKKMRLIPKPRSSSVHWQSTNFRRLPVARPPIAAGTASCWLARENCIRPML